MSTELITLFFFGSMALALFIGVPIFIAIGGSAAIFALIFKGPAMLYTLPTSFFAQGTSMTLLTIPMFTLMGNFLVHSGVSEKMFNGMTLWVSGIRGGLAIVSLIICVALAMCGGFGPGILTMGLIAVPAMLKNNYNKRLTVGSVMAGGTLGEIIPPSIAMIIFADVGRMSIGKIFAAGVVPGFILATAFLIYIIVYGIVRPDQVPTLSREVKITWTERLYALRDVLVIFGFVGLVLGSIITGVATPTEAACVGAAGSVLICALYKRLTHQVIKDACQSTLSIIGMVMWIIGTAALFNVVYTSIGAGAMIQGFVGELQVNRWVILIAMQMILMVFGMFMDDAAIIILCAPIFLPIVKLLNFDLYWFAITFVLNLQMAFLSPPFGYGLIMMKSVAPPSVSTLDLWKSVPPFIIMQLLVLIAVMVFPQLALWLPDRYF